MSDKKLIASYERKPNIVFAFADDWGRYANIYSKYENQAPITSSVNKFIHTPNFDRVAKEGVLFLNALVPAPSCTPCRSSVLSGRYFWQTGLGAILSGAVWDNDIQTFPIELEKNGGYFIGYTYKHSKVCGRSIAHWPVDAQRVLVDYRIPRTRLFV